jgi:hypothetical protein
MRNALGSLAALLGLLLVAVLSPVDADAAPRASWDAVDVALRTAFANAQAAVTQTATAFERPTAYYRNCTDVRAAGASPLHRGDPGYRGELDGNDDGVACE